MTVALIIIGILLALFIFLICPAIRKHPDRKLLEGKFIAHRGYHTVNGTVENSLSSFKAAAEAGFIIENDIHLTKDGEVLVFHDDNLVRMCGSEIKPEESTLAELKEFCLIGSDEKIPTLKECLEVVDGRVPLLIEFKGTDCEHLCTAANEILKDYNGKYFIQSFNPLMVRWYKKNRPDIMRGQLASAFYKEPLKLKLVGALLLNFLSRPDFVSYEFRYENNFFRRFATFLGAFPVAWTYRNREDYEKTKNTYKTFIFERFIP